jgi:antibiotic biosynthesis monooxygenase (ABM) superfamily enzyme
VAANAPPATATDRLKPATVVVTQRVRPGRADAFRRWQDSINLAVASFAGFLGTEVMPPDAGGDEWTVIYRFDSTVNLETWLESPARQSLLEQASDLLSEPADQEVLVSEQEEQVAVVVSHRVRPEDEADFLEWQQRVTSAEREFPGFRGSELFRPQAGIQDDWAVVYRFDSAEHLDAWLNSNEREKLLAEGAKFRDFELRRITAPFGNWFASADDPTAPPPPSWKSALAVLIGLYPTVVLLTLATAALWSEADLWADLLVGNIVSTILLTWLVMPFVTRAMSFWLAPNPDADQSRVNVLGAAVAIGFIALSAVVFWLVTVVFWTLP